ncbi:signal peptidase I [Kocuria marina]|uniref:Signal peptidase I n=1 Tax=Kocuria marina subsp. indica TaxID=1049583 RepID=A0A1X7CEU0_9MICC|nr:signal peptidase I [Kocuria indica]OXS84395.1 signal peptidase I [Kocuria indica]RLP58758.1 signal peptidase I [Kocuria indica]SME95369.1 signal peptidase I [Kocuria indica]
MAEQHESGVQGARGPGEPTPANESEPVAETRSDRGGRASSRRRDAKKPTTGWGAVKEILIVVALALIIAFLVKTFLIRGFFIPSGSMEQTLELNDRIFVNVLDGRTGNIDRGDIVVFEDTQGWLPEAPRTAANPVRGALEFVGLFPDSSQQALVKRVIGVGGDHVTCCDASGRVTVNGEALDEPYLYPGAAPSDIPFDVTVPDGKLFVLGDHRNASADSRYHIATGTGFVSEDDVVGTAFMIAWPLDRFQFLHNPAEVFQDVPAAGGQ